MDFLPSLLSKVKKCVDCSGLLQAEAGIFKCTTCSRAYTPDKYGVWDFREINPSPELPDIYRDSEFLRWLDIFQKKESKNWIIYKNWLYKFFTQAGHKALGRRIKNQNKGTNAILEVGAGTGTILEYIQAKNYVAVDLSIEGLRVLKQKHPNATAICASATSLPFERKSFDQIISLHMLEHMYFLSEAIQEISRVMTDNGEFNYVIPTEGGLGFSLGRKLITGPHLKKTYKLDVNTVMDREHINDAPRVIKFLNMHFQSVSKTYWPFKFLPFLSINAMINGSCKKKLLPAQNLEVNK